ATIINVPADQPNIQAGIDAATNTDTVLVQPGTYFENINYYGKNITVASLFLTTQDITYISSTIMNGNSTGSVVTFENSENSSAVLCGFTITNGAATYGGGIYCEGSSPSLVNLIISDNFAFGTIAYGGGIHCYYFANPTIVNVTISDNLAMYSGGGISSENYSFPSLINSILWNNTPDEIYTIMSSVTATYSDIEGGWTGEGNIDSDPLFEDPFNGNYHLTENSPCIDAGDPSSPLDPDGTIADMGAFYYDQGNAIDDNEIPISELDLSNHPNPFNPVTTISFDIKENETGTLTLFNIKGQIIESQQFESGNHSYLWDASNQTSGIYLYKLQTQTITETKKMLLLK
ncbi:MAG: T9SS type A sorting domain-containing protein, partial [Candidatus Cloacimonetes bacterium]|nr:T9SS type A sorting domain-containing protein [Candidatus Cloacimonadota bacterium]